MLLRLAQHIAAHLQSRKTSNQRSQGIGNEHSEARFQVASVT